MLVVIAIIGLLAGMIVPLAGLVAKKKILARTRSEVDNLALAIDTYKAKKGFYPPDNTNGLYGPCTNQLFYELWGMVLQNPTTYLNTYNANPNGAGGFETITTGLLGQFFGASGIVNASADTNEIRNFIPRINAAELQNIGSSTVPVWVFATPARGPTTGLPVPPVAGGQPVNVIRYVSSNPTNNPSSYDLWVDVLIGGKTNRISNWNKDSEIVY